MQEETLNIDHAIYFKIEKVIEKLRKIEDEHSPFARFLLYSAVGFTIFTFLYIILDRMLSPTMSRILNITFRTRGGVFKVYHFVLMFIGFLGGVLIIFLLQNEQFKDNLKLDTMEKKMYRLKYKWLSEEQIWLMAIILFEVTGIFKLCMLNDKRISLENGIILEEKENEGLINQENLPTAASEIN